MSVSRDLIVARLSTIDRLEVYPREPAIKTALAAWPVLRQVSRDGTLTAPFTRAYDVFVVLGTSTMDTAIDQAEDLIEELVDVLEEVGDWVQPAETIQIAFDNQTSMPGIRVRVVPDPDQ